MFLDSIEVITKIVNELIANPKQFTFIAVTALSLNAFIVLIGYKRHKRALSKYATTIVALYDSEKAALELLKENDVEQGNKKTVRSLAYESGGYSTKVYRSEAIRYAKKDN